MNSDMTVMSEVDTDGNVLLEINLVEDINAANGYQIFKKWW